MKDEWYQLDTGWACGGIHLQEGKIVETAPIFRKAFMGKTVELLRYMGYKVTPLN
jgi:hypothetical protein